MELNVKKKEVRRDSVINRQFNHMIESNDLKFKVFMKGMKGHRKLVDYKTQSKNKYDRAIAPKFYQRNLGNRLTDIQLAFIKNQVDVDDAGRN